MYRISLSRRVLFVYLAWTLPLPVVVLFFVVPVNEDPLLTDISHSPMLSFHYPPPSPPLFSPYPSVVFIVGMLGRVEIIRIHFGLSLSCLVACGQSAMFIFLPCRFCLVFRMSYLGFFFFAGLFSECEASIVWLHNRKLILYTVYPKKRRPIDYYYYYHYLFSDR